MEYIIVFQLLAGAFAAYVASRKGRSWFLWALFGALVPVVGAVCALLIGPARPAGAEPTQAERREEKLKRVPRRCCGRYIPDCRGCPFFRRPLFDRSYEGDKRGYCERFDKELTAPKKTRDSKISVERE
jgi:hypothetical protein